MSCQEIILWKTRCNISCAIEIRVNAYLDSEVYVTVHLKILRTVPAANAVYEALKQGQT